MIRFVCVALLFAVSLAGDIDVSGQQTALAARRSLNAAKSPPKKSPSPKKSPPKKSPPKKSPPKKSPPKKSPPKKSPPKTSPKKSPPKTSPKPSPPSGGKHVIEVGPGGLFVFKPAKVNAKVGDTIEFQLKSLGHNVHFSSGPSGVNLDAISDVGMLVKNPGYKYSFTIKVKGTYGYECLPHAGVDMKGTIVVS